MKKSVFILKKNRVLTSRINETRITAFKTEKLLPAQEFFSIWIDSGMLFKVKYL